MANGLITVYYITEEQRKNLAGGPSQTEMLVAYDILKEARRRALNLSTRVSTVHRFYDEGAKGIEKEVIALNGDVVIVIPTVDNLLQTQLDTYIEKGWPGLLLQSDDYRSLKRTAELLGNLPLPSENCKYLRSS